MGRLLAGLLMVLAACTGSGAGPASLATTEPPDRLLEISSVECPTTPRAAGGFGAGEFALWPHDLAGDLVPDFESVCATPTAPHLFALLNEEAGWTAGDLDAAAAGILHRGSHKTLATFTAFRVSQETPGLEAAEAQLDTSGAAVTTVGNLKVGWGRADGHVTVFFLDERDIVALTADGEKNAVDALTAWFDGIAVTVPRDIPELGAVPPALEAGPVLARLPAGYSALEIDPISFMASDFADEITIHENEDVESLGAAVILRDGRRVVGTLVSGSGTAELAEWAGDFTQDDVPAAGFAVGDTGGFVVGYDQDEVERFAEAWEKELKGS